MAKLELVCSECKKVFLERYRGQRNTTNKLCSEECKKIFAGRLSSVTMAKTNKKYASELALNFDFAQRRVKFQKLNADKGV